VNPLRQLREAGQSVWLDFLRRRYVTSGGLEQRVREDAVAGVTSNPTIFGRAIAGSSDYDEAIARLATRGVRDPHDAFLDLALDDVRMAADVLRPLHAETGRRDGFVSFELDPALAHDAVGSIAAARDLAARIGKPNVMIKVPGTAAGRDALEELTAAGVSVNVTLLFSVDVYERFALAYLAGLERRLEAGRSLDRVASVASFFVSRIDTAVDPLLPDGSPLRGHAAISNAKMAYQRFQDVFSGERWQRLADAGATVQRPLWASTGTKNPAYPDTYYVEALVGPDTVNTIPEATLDAFRDHGLVRPSAVTEDLESAEATLSLLPAHGIDLDQVAGRLLDEGLAAFETDLEKLLGAIEERIEAAGPQRRRHMLRGPAPLEARLQHRLDEATQTELVARLWRRDHTLWKPDPSGIANRLGWLDLPETMAGRLRELRRFAHDVRADRFRHVVLAGMGGSSLAAEVYHQVFGVAPGAPDLTVLDTTHPRAIASLLSSLDLAHTLVIAASKSGATSETLAHVDLLYNEIGRGEQFVAITDPGTPLEAMAGRRRFRRVFLNPADVGGRYSALSLFGLVPAALIGADLDELLEAGAEMAAACHACVPDDRNPGLWLGLVLGEAARGGWDKLTPLLPPEVAPLGPWIEQLVAESTGKEGAGIVPVVDEDVGSAEIYGPDRMFVALGYDGEVDRLEGTGCPLVRLGRRETVVLGSEIVRWEIAIAIAGHVLGINPFDEPNVTESKDETRLILDRMASGPSRRGPDLGEDVEPDPLEAADLLEKVGTRDYIALLAFVEPDERNAQRLNRARRALRDRYRVATTVGFGPRYLHSTGQLHKGGPGSGVFIQVVDDDKDEDLVLPARRYTLRQLIDAQALGDLLALRRHGRRVARIRLSQLEEVIS
jgi:transaldolase / glucose-6-phosphate isomerase